MYYKNNYLEQYKSPLWQKKRLEIMQRDGFKCALCGDTRKMLNVHHKIYLKDKKIWEYPDELLITLCEYCHKTEHREKIEYEHYLLETLYSKGLMAEDLGRIANTIETSIKFYYEIDYINEIFSKTLTQTFTKKNQKELMIKIFGKEIEKERRIKNWTNLIKNMTKREEGTNE